MAVKPSCRQITLLVLMTIVIAPLLFPTHAQAASEHALLQMLALVPDIKVVRQLPWEGAPPGLTPWVTFVNYRAAFEADPKWPRPTNYADYMAQVKQGREEIRYGPSSQMIYPGLPRLGEGTSRPRDPVTLGLTGPRVGEVMPEKMGMDYFDIYYGMEFGSPPATGLIFGGALDLDAVGAAHQARGYTEQKLQGFRLWCSGKPGFGCTNPNAYDSTGTEPYNLFDGRMGRQPPFFGAGQMLAGAFDYDLLLAMIDTAADKQASLADATDFRTLAEALLDPTRYPSDLIQAAFFQPASVVKTLDLTRYRSVEAFVHDFAPKLTPAEVEAFMVPLEWQTYGPLPAYKMVAVGDRQAGAERVALIAALYDNLPDAQAALPELTARLVTYAGTLVWHQYDPLFGKARLRSSYVYTSTHTGWSVAVVTFGNSPAQSKNQGQADVNVLAQSTEGVLSEAFYPLWHITPADWLMRLERKKVPAKEGR